MARSVDPKTATATLVVLSYVGFWMAMEWAGKSNETLFLVVGVAIVIAAGYQLWGENMGQGVEAVGELREGNGDDEDGDGEA